MYQPYSTKLESEWERERERSKYTRAVTHQENDSMQQRGQSSCIIFVVATVVVKRGFFSSERSILKLTHRPMRQGNPLTTWPATPKAAKMMMLGNLCIGC